MFELLARFNDGSTNVFCMDQGSFEEVYNNSIKVSSDDGFSNLESSGKVYYGSIGDSLVAFGGALVHDRSTYVFCMDHGSSKSTTLSRSQVMMDLAKWKALVTCIMAPSVIPWLMLVALCSVMHLPISL
jgi:hypothetical protein